MFDSNTKHAKINLYKLLKNINNFFAQKVVATLSE